MTSEEVRLVMNGWLENQSQLALVGQLSGLGMALHCRVGALTEFGIELTTSDGGRLAVSLWETGAEFKYAEPREFPALEASCELTAAQRIASSVSALFPVVEGSDDSERECISFIELVR